MLLAELGRLPNDYPLMTSLFDTFLIEKLALDTGRLLEFVRTEHPDYLTFERWVIANGKTLSLMERDVLNERYREQRMSPQKATVRRSELGLTDASLGQGILLNDLDDWSALHRYLLAESREARM